MVVNLLEAGLRRRGLEVRAAVDLTASGVRSTAMAYCPHVVVLDLALGGGVDGTDLIDGLSTEGAKVLVLTGAGGSPDLAQRCAARGATKVLSKSSPFSDLLSAVADVAELAVADGRGRGASQRDDAPPSELAALSGRERQVLYLLVGGRSAKEIAAAEFISVATVRTHIRSILRKLHVRSQLAAVAQAHRAGWEITDRAS